MLIELLEAAPGVQFLVTSQVGLNLHEEWRLDLAGLPFPDTEALHQLTAPDEASPDLVHQVATFDSVQLFAQRARQTNLSFKLDHELNAVATICHLLEGMPLALELAAARVRTQRCAEIVGAIQAGFENLQATARNLPARQRSLRATFENTWHLLSPEDQVAFADLGVFHDSFSIAAAAAVAGVTAQRLSEISAQALIHQVADDRYRMHAMLRHFAQQYQENAPQTATRHSHYFAALADSYASALQKGEPARIRGIAGDDANLAAAWAWACAQADTATIATLLEPLCALWELGGQLDEGRNALLQGLESVPINSGRSQRCLRGKLSLQLARFHDLLGDYVAACSWAQRSYELFEPLAEPQLTARAQLVWGFAQAAFDDNATAAARLHAARNTFVAAGDVHGVADTLVALSYVETVSGDRAVGRANVEQALNAYEALGQRRGAADCLFLLGNYAIGDGDYKRAGEYYAASRQLHTEIGNRLGHADCLRNEALAALYSGRLEHAEISSRAALRYFQRSGQREQIVKSLRTLGEIAYERGHFTQAQQLFEQGLSEARSIGSPTGIGQLHALLSATYTAAGNPAVGRRHAVQALERLSADATPNMLLFNLPAIVETLIGNGASDLAAQTLGHILAHPLSEARVRDLVRRITDQLAPHYSTQTLAEHRATGRSAGLHEIVTAIRSALDKPV